MKRFLIILTLLAPLLVIADGDHERAKALFESGEILSLEQILKNIRDEYPGRLLEIKLEQKKKMVIYEVELLDEQGRVWELKLDAVTGELLKREQDD